ncbi:MAG TPA: hypothetical protein VGH76_11380 [Actinomycetospora sp.]
MIGVLVPTAGLRGVLLGAAGLMATTAVVLALVRRAGRRGGGVGGG